MNLKKTVLITICLVFVSGKITNQFKYEETPLKLREPDEFLHIYSFPIGQGDAFVVQCPAPGGHVTLIDMGSVDRDNFWGYKQVKNFFEEKTKFIRNIIITHFHMDHYNLFNNVFNGVKSLPYLKKIFISCTIDDAPNSLLKWAKKLGILDKITTINGGLKCGPNKKSCGIVNICPGKEISDKILIANWGGQCKSQLKPSEKNKTDLNENTNSPVIQLKYGNTKVLFEGDFEDFTSSSKEDGPSKALADYYKSKLKSDIYQLAHHGAELQANKKFLLKYINPSAIFVSGNPYSRYIHPRCSVINDIEETCPSLCKPYEFSGGKNFCGPHPLSSYNITRNKTLQKKYICGDTKTLKYVSDNVYAIYTTMPANDTLNFYEIFINKNSWGFLNHFISVPRIKNQEKTTKEKNKKNTEKKKKTSKKTKYFMKPQKNINYEETPLKLREPDEFMHIYSLPLGEGDAYVVQCPAPGGHVTLIDMGSLDRDKFWGYKQVKKFFEEKTKYIRNIIITHFHMDHYNLFDNVFTEAKSLPKLRKVLISCTIEDLPNQMIRWINKMDLTTKLITLNKGFPCGPNKKSCGVVSICPSKKVRGKILIANWGGQCKSQMKNKTEINENTNSLVIQMKYGKTKVLFDGDFEDFTSSSNEDGPSKALADYYKSKLRSDIYQLAVQGAEFQANKNVLLKHIKPSAIFVSGNPYSRYRHPRCASIFKVMKLFSLCKPHSQKNESNYCGPHPLTSYNISRKATLQKEYICGDDKDVNLIKNNNYAIYSTMPTNNTINLYEIVLSKNSWGFVNHLIRVTEN